MRHVAPTPRSPRPTPREEITFGGRPKMINDHVSKTVTRRPRPESRGIHGRARMRHGLWAMARALSLTMSVRRVRGEVTSLAMLSPREPFRRCLPRPGAHRLSRHHPIRTQLSSHPHPHGLHDAPQARLKLAADCYPTHRGISTDIFHSRNGPHPSAT